MTSTCIYKSPVGYMRLRAGEVGLTEALFIEDEDSDGDNLIMTEVKYGKRYLNEAVRWLDLYFSGREPDFTPRLYFDDRNQLESDFRQMLTEVRYGQLVTYCELSRRITERTSSRTNPRLVGRLLAKNQFHLIIPCHRVINANGTIGGYAAGVELKHKLLLNESSLIL